MRSKVEALRGVAAESTCDCTFNKAITSSELRITSAAISAALPAFWLLAARHRFPNSRPISAG
jgi:hypothetical protein